jgi:prophage maintenance system killer protein
MPPKASSLPDLFDNLTREFSQIAEIYEQAIHLFLIMARTHFSYDVNKRMGRFIMNGLLLNAGFPAFNLPAKRQLEFNSLMLDFYEAGEEKPMNEFLRSCLDQRVISIMFEGNGHDVEDI